ncbi:MAG: hypothetical protein V1926_00245 [Candidatus Peregrinibacteria bacterium]
MAVVQCAVSGESFTVSDAERGLREKFGFGDSLPSVKIKYRFRELGAFWPHWNLHPRTCDKTGKTIISIFRPDCPYPVWDRAVWVKDANPPSAEFSNSRSFFEQAWDLFRRCPLPHNFQSHNENSEYTDDFYSQQSQLCSDLVHSNNCYSTIYALYCQNVQDSAFLYDCRRCAHCLFCTNLRDKQFCFENKQLTQEEYADKISGWNLRSRQDFKRAKDHLHALILEQGWHRAVHVDHCENTQGNYLMHCKNCEDCFISPWHEDCVHDLISGHHAKLTLDSMGTIGSELSYHSVMDVYCYGIRFSFELNECKSCDYCAYCFNCRDCFGCCGLFGKRYCILNRQYTEQEYRSLKENVIAHMQRTPLRPPSGSYEGQAVEWGSFFPGHFAPNPYDESCSGFNFPLSLQEQRTLGFRAAEKLERKTENMQSMDRIPDSVDALRPADESSITATVFWDDAFERPFKITKEDIAASRKLGIPLPSGYYIKRMQENLRWMPCDGELRETLCGKCGCTVLTSWPSAFDSRILCEEDYLKVVM